LLINIVNLVQIQLNIGSRSVVCYKLEFSRRCSNTDDDGKLEFLKGIAATARQKIVPTVDQFQ